MLSAALMLFDVYDVEFSSPPFFGREKESTLTVCYGGELCLLFAHTTQVVRPEDVDAELIAKEREVEMGKEDLKSKPEQIREKIVDGRINKRVNELSLSEQEYIRDTDKKVGEIVKETIAQLGENIQIRRFTR